MRRLIATAAVAVGLVAAAPAAASPEFANGFQMAFGSGALGVSTGLQTLMTWSDPGALFGVPAVLRRIQFQFPPGTTLNTAALPACMASDPQVVLEQSAACPAASVLGSGTTVGELATGAPIDTHVTLFNAPSQIIVLVDLAGLPATEFRDDVGTDTITVNPALPLGVSLTRLQLTVNPRTAGDLAYLRTPSSCPSSGQWTITATFSYANGPSDTRTSESPCQAAPAPPVAPSHPAPAKRPARHRHRRRR
ncbi:MAG TPA: hypothetical protein VHX88_16415 [Solirubrobacteraceae bacterium]|jgi:hypothetical protein|nr:hypothetical protein [Solirubrobacteraceae bacterium]